MDILGFLRRNYEKDRNRVAIEDCFGVMTYEEYYNKALIIGKALTSKVNKNNKPILVLSDDSKEMLPIFIGIACSGNFYVPIDANTPTDKLELMINELKPECIIGKADNNLFNFSNSTYFSYDSLICFKGIEEVQLPEVSENNYIYGIFTSGSTGKPKLVVKSRKSLYEMMQIFTETFKLNDFNVFGNQASFFFDISAKDIYLSLMHGARLVLIPKTYFSFPLDLLEYIAKKKIDTLIWSAFAIRLLYKFKALDNRTINMKLVMFSGEKLSVKELKYWLNHVEGSFYNLYGTTETTFNCTYQGIDINIIESLEELPIGIPFKDHKIKLVEDVEGDGLGEVWISGPSLADGYYNDKIKTELAFVIDSDNTRWYKSGDLARKNEKGLLVLAGRKDHQIKHMGYRIELDEIESIGNSFSKVYLSGCIYDSIKEKIHFFYEADGNIDGELFAHFKTKLPKYMIPTGLHHVSKIPLNNNNKVDRHKLREWLYDKSSK